MTGVVDSNFLYYMLQLNAEDVKPQLLEKLKKSGVEWCLSDVAFIESTLHNKNNRDNISKILDCYKEHITKMKVFFPDFDVNTFLSEKDGLTDVNFDFILTFKLKKEISYLIDLFKLISITYKEYCIEKYQLDGFKKQIDSNYNSFWRANKDYLSKLIKKELKKLYENDRYNLHRVLRQLLFSVLFCMEWNFLSGIQGCDVGTLRDKMEKEGLIPFVPNKNELNAIVDAINYGCESEDGKVCDARSKMLKNDVFRNRLNSKVALNGAPVKEFKKEIIRRILNEEACVMKNDYWDSIFMNLESGDYVLTYDKKFKNMIKTVNDTMFTNLDANLKLIESQSI